MPTDTPSHHDIFARLKEDHDRHRALFSMIEARDVTFKQRDKLFRELVHEIKGHAAAEEQAEGGAPDAGKFLGGCSNQNGSVALDEKYTGAGVADPAGHADRLMFHRAVLRAALVGG